MENTPVYIALLFVITALATVYFFYRATGKSSVTLIVILCWLLLQTVISLKGFYTKTDTRPPHILLLVMPPVIVIVLLFISSKGRVYLDALNIKHLTILHIVRVPVEFVLLLLFINGKVPQLMTFEGRNFDILSGLTAPIIYYFSFITNQLNRKVILAWNLVCLILLLNILINAVLSIPSPLQQFGFNMPNIAVLYFPYCLLPAFVVPIVLVSHLAVIRQLLTGKNKATVKMQKA